MLDILNTGASQGSGTYMIDPDGYGTGLAPFEVYCDMSPGNAGTEICICKRFAIYAKPVVEMAGDGSTTILCLNLPTHRLQPYKIYLQMGQTIGRCNGVIHYFTSTAAIMRGHLVLVFNGTTIGSGVSFATIPVVSVLQDGCATNGGELSSRPHSASTAAVPIVNVRRRDCGDSGEMFGSPLTGFSLVAMLFTQLGWLRLQDTLTIPGNYMTKEGECCLQCCLPVVQKNQILR